MFDPNRAYARGLEFWYHCDPTMKADGMDWYRHEHSWGLSIAKEFGLPEHVVFACLSALSPSSNWEQNKKDVINVLLYGSGATVTTYGRNKDKALRILDGSSITAELNKPTCLKTWHFFHCLSNPETMDHVAVDRHHAYVLGITDTAGGVRMTPNEYMEAVTITHELAGMVRYRGRRVRPCEFQAVTWGEAQLRKGHNP